MNRPTRFLLAAFFTCGVLVPAAAFAHDDDDNVDSSWTNWRKRARPFVEFSYGTDWPSHKRLAAELPSIGSLEIRAGYLMTDTVEGGLLSISDAFLFGGFSNDNLGGGSGGMEGLGIKLGRFGIGHREGYGYDLGGSSIVPYFLSSVSWTELTTVRPDSLSPDDAAIFDRYEGTFRFGPSAEGGLRATFGRTFSLSAGYEANIVYPRVVFWEFAGSVLVVGAANGIISWFGDDMIEASPALGPVFLFLLRSGAAFGIYQLWREDMNWPFQSETPLAHETLKFGMSFNL